MPDNESISHSPDDKFIHTRIEIEEPETFDPLTVLSPDTNKRLFHLWKTWEPSQYNRAAVAMIAEDPKNLKVLEEAGLLPEYFCYALEYVFSKGAKP